MQELIFEEPHRLRWREAPDPRLRSDDDAIVRPIVDMYLKGIRFRMSRSNVRRDIPHVLAAVASGKLHPESVATEEVPWDRAPEALAEPSMKPLLVRPPLAAAGDAAAFSSWG